MFGDALLLLARAEPDSLAQALEEGGMLAIVGMGVVFFALILLNLLLSVLNKMQVRQQLLAQAQAPAIPPVATTAHDEIEPEVLAVLTAAVIAAIGRPARIRSVRMIQRDESSAWADRGRARLQASHTLRKGTR